MGLISRTMILVILGTMFLGIAAINAQVNAELPQFRSGASVMMGVPVDFTILNQRVGAIYDVVESDSSHIVWKFTGTTGDRAFVFVDGRVAVASTVDFNLDAKDTLTKELNDVMDMLNAVFAGIVSDEARNNAINSAVYYASEPEIYHSLKYDFKGDINDFKLVVPDTTIVTARLGIEGVEDGPDYQVNGQDYYIDDEEVLQCRNCNGFSFNCGGCTTGNKDVTDKILPGLHKISGTAKCQHSMVFEAITSPMPTKEFVLYGPNYIPWINETGKSMTVDDLNSLIEGTSNSITEPTEEPIEETEVIFLDSNLAAAIRAAINKPNGTIYTTDLEGLKKLDAPEKGIKDIAGLEYCSNLEYLNLGGNRITDVSPLSGLTNMEILSLARNQITDVSPLSGLTKLTQLGLSCNPITDVSPLSGLTNLVWLDLGTNPITDVSPLSGLTKTTIARGQPDSLCTGVSWNQLIT